MKPLSSVFEFLAFSLVHAHRLSANKSTLPYMESLCHEANVLSKNMAKIIQQLPNARTDWQYGKGPTSRWHY